ncbi:MAG: ribose-phosphate pyrophosphokinase [Polaromonas sp.]|uniref:ribose-phosphate pyrophosphokinase n=1 Tax=Polaromonas sp. TaxID=1869339 RepID=UPI0027320E2D|nr:ribose-phosphate pyrophosphokinase [Polaromonas sp.]MDP1741627.1 ribose-phosphate pyrophosphokinase [Polaromonas sp.]MDP3750720.1 ribose-phosphate pyrophosphokinase [Polaromonas sp.]
MKPVAIAMPGNERLTDELAAELGLERGAATVRRFPDGESHVRVETAVEGRHAIIVCTLDRPDDKLVPLLLLACAIREAGAVSVGLVAPYLAYMRQDRQFHAGETISAQHVAAWISRHVDWLVTVDPHLHRIADLSQVYSIPSRVTHAAEGVASWVRLHVSQPLLIGPDEESAQWVRDVAQRAEVPFIILAKTRRGDRDVEVSVPEVDRWRSHTPVLVDDIVSTARTMIETVGHLRRIGLAAPVCVAVHAVFAQTAFEDLHAAGAADIVSCDTISHPSNRIGLASAIASSVRELLP